MTATAAVRTPRGPWKWGPFVKESSRNVIPALLWTLHDLGGVIEDHPRGRCGFKLISEAVKRGYVLPKSYTNPSSGSLSSLLGELDFGLYAGCIARDKNAKRTFKMTLLLSEDELPPRPHPVKTTKVQPTVKAITAKQRPIAPVAVFVPKDEDSVEPEPDVETVPEPEVTEPDEQPFQPELPDVPQPEVEDIAVIPPLLTVDANDDAFMLMLEASQLIARAMIATNMRTPARTEPSDTDIDEAAKRMADTIAENQRLRRQLNEARETANARAKEAEGLRKALTVAHGNLKAFQQNMGMAEGREKALARLRDTQKTMAAPPTRRG